MTKQYLPRKGSATLKVMRFLERNPECRYTTPELCDVLKVSYKGVGNATLKLRQLGMITTAGLKGHQFVKNHGVVIGVAPNASAKVPRAPSKRSVRQAELAAGFAKENEERAAFRASNQSGYSITAADKEKTIELPHYPGMGNRAYVDPSKAPKLFSSIPLGATLVMEAA